MYEGRDRNRNRTVEGRDRNRKVEGMVESGRWRGCMRGDRGYIRYIKEGICTMRAIVVKWCRIISAESDLDTSVHSNW